MHNHTISVIIAVQNNADHIRHTLSSVASQTYAAHEIIVVDAGSTDDTMSVVAQTNHPNLTMLNVESDSIAAARNEALQHVNGEFVAFIEAGDEWMPMYLEQMMQLAERFPIAGALTSRYQFVVDNEGFRDADVALKHIPIEGMLIENFYTIASQGDLPFLLSSMVVRKEVLTTVASFPIDEPMAEYDFICQVAENYHIAYSPFINYLAHIETARHNLRDSIPTDEYPFSQRVMQRLNEAYNINRKDKQARIRFCATHLFTLANRNLHARNVAAAKTLLSDPRCWSKPTQKLALTLKCYALTPFARA